MQRIPIDKGWMPDYLPLAMPAGGLIEALNLLPYDEYYMSTMGVNNFSSDAMADSPNAGVMLVNNAGALYSFFGTPTKLYRLETNKSLTNISKAGGYATGNNQWSFAQYGEFVIATNFVNVPQILKPSFVSPNIFADVGGSPPKAKYCLLVNEHLLFGYLDEAGTISPKKLRWSARGDMEDYAASLTTGAGSQNLADAIGRMTGLAYVNGLILIFFEQSISIGWYSGAPFTFEFPASNIIRDIGALPGSIIPVGNGVFFLDRRDIYYFDGKSAPIPLGMGVKNTVLNSINYDYLHRITTAHDTLRGLVFWAYPQGGTIDGNATEILVYNYRAKRFTRLSTAAQCIYSRRRDESTPLATLEDLSGDYPELDKIPFSLDSEVWIMGLPGIGFVRTTNYVGMYTGVVRSATLETGELTTGKISRIINVRPIIENAVDPIIVSVGSRFQENADPAYTADSTVGSNGYANLRQTGRYLRTKLTLAGHKGLSGLEVDLEDAGER